MIDAFGVERTDLVNKLNPDQRNRAYKLTSSKKPWIADRADTVIHHPKWIGNPEPYNGLDRAEKIRTYGHRLAGGEKASLPKFLRRGIKAGVIR